MISRFAARFGAVLFVRALAVGVIVTFGAPVARAQDSTAAKLNLQKGDHICFIGGTLAELMQHDGWLEALLHQRFPQHELVVRNLGYSGDELTLRLRSAGFGSPDDHLNEHKADVIFAMFGYGESFAGEAGLAKFKTDLAAFVDHTLSQKYNGHSPPRLVLFSPIAFENLHDPNLPDGKEQNERIGLFVEAIREVAAAKNVPFVDLWTPSLAYYRNSDLLRVKDKAATQAPLTSNGIHLTELGDRVIAEAAMRSLFEVSDRQSSPGELERLRQAVIDKNFYWFHHYRVTDGYSTYGGRSRLEFVDKQTNYDVLQRELEVLNVMTTNRDKRVWAVAQGKDRKVDDSNTPPLLKVISNKPGPLPGGKHAFLGGEESISRMTVAPGMKVTLFASEEQFPDVINPVQMSFDAKGRLWVATWPSYPHWIPKEEMNDKLLILEDTNGDGRADRSLTFADHLHNPTGFEFWNGGVFVAMAPDLLFLKDTDGDDRADVRQSVLHGIDSADTHHTANSFTIGPGGALFFQEGTFHHTQVETPYGVTRCANAGVFRYEPRRQEFDAYVSYPFANPHGHVFDRWGQDIITDGTSADPYHAAIFSGHVNYPSKHHRAPTIYEPRTRPCPAIEVLSSRHFPAENQGNLLVGNVIGFQGILQYKLADDGSSFTATEVEPILSSSDQNFRPCDIEIGPDGAIWFTDWQNPIIGHLQHNLRDPNRDRTHGRVYRVTREGQPLLKAPTIAGASIPALLDLLKEPENRVRYRARIELGARNRAEVLAALAQWTAALDAKDPEHEHHLLEALWVSAHHEEVNLPLLDRVLKSSDFRARAAATRLLCDWRDRVSDSLERFKHLAQDPHPRVRLEAVRAASFYTKPDTVEVIAVATAQPTDRFIDYVRGETLMTLNPYLKRALARGGPIATTTPEGAAYVLRMTSTERLQKMDRSAAVLEELVIRSGLTPAQRREFVTTLAKARGSSETDVLVAAIHRIDARRDHADTGIIFELARELAASSKGASNVRPLLEQLAKSAQKPVIREIAFATLTNGDGSANEAWQLAVGSVTGLKDFLEATPFISDTATRAALYDRIDALLDRMPETLAAASPDEAATIRRAAMTALTYVRGQERRSFERIARFVNDEQARPAAIGALKRIAPADWPKEQVQPLIDVLLGQLRNTPPKNRTSADARAALEFAGDLAALLPVDDARKVRAELNKIGVRLVHVGTVLERMSYDRETLAIQAGRPVEIVFENSDVMPHNLVVVQPGAMEEIGVKAEETALDPDAFARSYVPRSDKVILSSKLVVPHESARLNFRAPKEPGVYPFVRTYPGHWRRMYGALYVVADLDAYLAAPEEYLAANHFETKDELLKDRRPRTEWKLDDLAETVTALESGRSYSAGKQLFQVANCVACHKLDGVGVTMGPDLAQLDAKLSPLDILKELLEPSNRINEKFQAYTFVLDSGRAVTGLIVEETPTQVKVVENPLAKAEPVVLEVSEITSRIKSPASMMPKGLLDKLSRDEILDLLAYVACRGNKESPLFKGAHEHCHEH